jgi:hypothetical protein
LIFQTSKDDFELLKEKGQKAKNLLLKVFARSTSDSSKASTSKNVKNVDGNGNVETSAKIEAEPLPIPGNETILESEPV